MNIDFIFKKNLMNTHSRHYISTAGPHRLRTWRDHCLVHENILVSDTFDLGRYSGATIAEYRGKIEGRVN